jgi:sugar phosphate permease
MARGLQNSFLIRPDARRWRLAYVLMITLFVGYLDRVNISLAVPLMAAEYGWDDETLSRNGQLLFALFYVGYGLSNIFLSPFAARIGPRRSLIMIILLWSLFTALGAFVSQFLLVLAATRVLLGVSEGVHFPVMNMLTKAWFPPEERGRANSIWISGLLLAVLLSPVFLVPAMHAFGWRVGFWALGLAGLLAALPLVLRLVRDRPELDPAMREEEIAHIREGCRAEREHEASEDGASSPGRLRRLFLSPNFLLLLAAGVLNNIVSLGLLSWLPSFFVRTRGVPYEQLTWMVSLPFAGSILGVWLWSNLGDRFSNRALIAACGYFAAGGLVFVSLSAEALWMMVTFFALAVFMTSAWVAGEFALLQRVLPARSVGGDSGLYNGLTTLVGGSLGSVVVAAIVGNPESADAAARLLVIPATCTLLALILVVVHARIRY